MRPLRRSARRPSSPGRGWRRDPGRRSRCRAPLTAERLERPASRSRRRRSRPAGSSPAIASASVLLPEPLSPMTASRSPAARSRPTPPALGTSRRRGDSGRGGRGSTAAASRQASALPPSPRPRLRRRDRRRARSAPARCPGMIDRNGAVRSTVRPSAIMPPQVTRLGSPRPRKDSAASVRTAPATMTDDSASTGGSALGSTSRKAISSGRMPMTRARGDVVALADRQHFGARDARRSGPGAERDGDHDHAERRADDADEGQRQQEARHGLEGVGDAHQHLVDEAAGKAGQRADHRADDERRGGRRERRPPARCGRRGTMPASTSRPSRSVPSGSDQSWKRRQQRRPGDRQRVAGKEQRREQRQRSEQPSKDQRAGQRLPACAGTAATLMPASLAPTRGSSKA